ncbi:MAG TPA: aminotransferase class I/II-fold pyridoxal phosphate-dependent enzyme [Isosphaeraceae bacterium]|jgi:aspartate/methionine/tyrosine aminotransferase|nr:aminotransferase class I/II-fold pyridoxal phosphate-dependent enzyme [Isosphaeraceae bacterium]
MTALAPNAQRLGALRPTAVNAVLAEANRLKAVRPDLVSLMRGQPDTPTPAHIVEAALKALRAGRTGYPDNSGEPSLRLAVAEKLEREQGLRYDPETEILITDGATGGLCAALGALVAEGDDVLLPDPVYDAYNSPIGLWGARAVPVRSSVRAGRFTIEPQALDEACKSANRPRALLLNSPWNPVGTVFERDELCELMEVADRHGLWVLSDEIYEALVYDGRRHISGAALSQTARSRTLIINSLSKTYAMTGWRVGYCAGPADLVKAMALVWPQWSRGPATFVQDAATEALRGDQACVRDMATEYQGRRDRLIAALGGIPDVIPYVPEGGLFVMLDVRALGLGSDAIRRFLLHECGVVVIHGAAYGSCGEGTLRVSFAAGGASLDLGLDRLRQGLTRLASCDGVQATR